MSISMARAWFTSALFLGAQEVVSFEPQRQALLRKESLQPDSPAGAGSDGAAEVPAALVEEAARSHQAWFAEGAQPVARRCFEGGESGPVIMMTFPEMRLPVPPMTVMAHVRTSEQGEQDILRWDSPKEDQSFVLRINAAEKLEFSMNDGASRQKMSTVMSPSLNDGEWHTIALVREGDSSSIGVASLYVDHVQVMEAYMEGVTTDLNPWATSGVPGSGPGALIEKEALPFQGDVKRVRVFDDALSSNALMKASSDPCAVPIYMKGKHIHSNLGGFGPDKGEQGMRISNVTTFRGAALDLLVQNLTEYKPANGEFWHNGIDSLGHGRVSVEPNVPIRLNFELVKTGTRESVIVDEFLLAFYTEPNGTAGAFRDTMTVENDPSEFFLLNKTVRVDVSGSERDASLTFDAHYRGKPNSTKALRNFTQTEHDSSDSPFCETCIRDRVPASITLSSKSSGDDAKESAVAQEDHEDKVESLSLLETAASQSDGRAETADTTSGLPAESWVNFPGAAGRAPSSDGPPTHAEAASPTPRAPIAARSVPAALAHAPSEAAKAAAAASTASAMLLHAESAGSAEASAVDLNGHLLSTADGPEGLTFKKQDVPSLKAVSRNVPLAGDSRGSASRQELLRQAEQAAEDLAEQEESAEAQSDPALNASLAALTASSADLVSASESTGHGADPQEEEDEEEEKVWEPIETGVSKRQYHFVPPTTAWDATEGLKGSLGGDKTGDGVVEEMDKRPGHDPLNPLYGGSSEDSEAFYNQLLSAYTSNQKSRDQPQKIDSDLDKMILKAVRDPYSAGGGVGNGDHWGALGPDGRPLLSGGAGDHKSTDPAFLRAQQESAAIGTEPSLQHPASECLYALKFERDAGASISILPTGEADHSRYIYFGAVTNDLKDVSGAVPL